MSHRRSGRGTTFRDMGLLLLAGLLTAAAGCGGSKPSPTTAPGPASTPPPARLRAGLRASPYGITPFPQPAWWGDSTRSMASRFDAAAPAVVWIVGTYEGRHCWLKFPAPSPEEKYPNVIVSYQDYYKPYLDLFDQLGVQVWLQVEPGDADVATLIDLALRHYSSHPSVVGFGVDVEWYQRKDHKDGKAVTDEEARAWVERVRSYNPAYRLFLKHWLVEKMPPTYRDGILFLDDGQGFQSLDEMIEDFSTWGRAFAPAPVGYQYGYLSDRPWWKALSDPPGEIGRVLLERIPHTTDLIWVDFTALEIWPYAAP